jgi:hypothetical protein
MAISRAQLLKELLPGLNALFGLEYAKYGDEAAEIFETESSDRSFEEETKLSGFGAAPVKGEGSAIDYDNAQEAWTARYTHETIAMGFSLTEEAIEDNLYDSLSSRYTKALARAMAYTKQVKGAAILNNAFTPALLTVTVRLCVRLTTHSFLVVLTQTVLLLQLTLTKLHSKLLLFRSLVGLMSAVCLSLPSLRNSLSHLRCNSLLLACWIQSFVCLQPITTSTQSATTVQSPVVTQ